MKKLTRWLTGGNFIFVVGFVILLFLVSERWWLGTMATYAPRAIIQIPSLLLVCLSLITNHSSLFVNLGLWLLIVGVAMEFNIPSWSRHAEAESAPITIVSCNVGKYKPDFESALPEIFDGEVTVVALQEAIGRKPESLLKATKGWNVAFTAEFWVASQLPTRLVGRCWSNAFNRESAIAVHIQHPTGDFIVINVHTRSAQWGMKDLLKGGVNSSNVMEKFNETQSKRLEEMREVREFVEQVRGTFPIVVLGDFNAPSSSSIFRSQWKDFTNAFEVSKWGYGYTAPCDGKFKSPPGWPWIRIDHILINGNWNVVDFSQGKRNGSDHRVIRAVLNLRPRPPHHSHTRTSETHTMPELLSRSF